MDEKYASFGEETKISDHLKMHVIDNCFFWRMTKEEMEIAFLHRLKNIERWSEPYRVKTLEDEADATFLPRDWPLSQFSTPDKSRVMVIATFEDEMCGFLEASVIARDCITVLSCVVFPSKELDQTYITRKMFQQLIDDGVAMEIPKIVVPKQLNDYKPAEKFYAARYNFNTKNTMIATMHRVAIASVLHEEYPYIYFNTPFKKQYIFVTKRNNEFLDLFVQNFLQGSLEKDLDYYRTYNLSLWRLYDEATKMERMLRPSEVDIITEWQRTLVAHEALELRGNMPVALFGLKIILVPEDPDRMTIVGYRNKTDIPPEAKFVEDALWAHAIAAIKARVYTPQDVPFESHRRQRDVAYSQKTLLQTQKQNDVAKQVFTRFHQRGKEERQQERKEENETGQDEQQQEQVENIQDERHLENTFENMIANAFDEFGFVDEDLLRF